MSAGAAVSMASGLYGYTLSSQSQQALANAQQQTLDEMLRFQAISKGPTKGPCFYCGRELSLNVGKKGCDGCGGPLRSVEHRQSQRSSGETPPEFALDPMREIPSRSIPHWYRAKILQTRACLLEAGVPLDEVQSFLSGYYPTL